MISILAYVFVGKQILDLDHILGDIRPVPVPMLVPVYELYKWLLKYFPQVIGVIGGQVFIHFYPRIIIKYLLSRNIIQC